MKRPIHGMAALLHPLYKSPELFMDGSLLFLRDKFMTQVMSEEQQIQLDREMIGYSNNLGESYSRSVSMRPEVCKAPLDWWETHGYNQPMLRTLALRVLSQVATNFYPSILILGYKS